MSKNPLHLLTGPTLKDLPLITDYNQLLITVASDCDAVATVYIYDKMKETGVLISDAAWAALNTLERADHRRIYLVPQSTRQTLSPGRRIHKICKGPRLHARSEAAKEVLDQALTWLHCNNISGLPRMRQVHLLAKGLNIPLETARGLVTKLKQKRVINSVKDS